MSQRMSATCYLGVLLRRSCPSKLHISVQALSEGAIFLAPVLPHFHRLQYLKITVTTWVYSEQRPTDAWRAVHDMLCEAAPWLENLLLEDNHRYDLVLASARNLPASLLSDQVGKLRTCSLLGVRLPPNPCVAFRGLRALTYWSLPRTLSESDLDDILAHCPALEYLKLDLEELLPCETPSTAHHDRLASVTISVALGALHILEYFSTIPEVALNAQQADIQATHEHLHHLIHMDCGMAGSRAHYATETRRIVLQVGHTGSVNWMARDLLVHPAGHPHLRSLNIQEPEWCSCDRLPPLPQLRELTICLSSCTDYANQLRHIFGPADGMAGIWHSALAQRGVNCPALEELYLLFLTHFSCDTPFLAYWGPEVCCSCANGCTIALDSVVRFMLSALPHVSSESRLRRVVLSGIRAIVDYDLAAAYAALYRLVDELDFAESPPAHLQDMQDWRTHEEDHYWDVLP